MNSAPTVIPCDGRSIKYLSENRDRYIAQSILYGFVPDPLPDTAAEARDIIHWHYQALAVQA